VLHLDRGDIVALEGDAKVPVFVVVGGQVAGYRIGVNGRVLTLARLCRGASFYIPCALGTCLGAPMSTRAIVPSTVISIRQQVFRTLVNAHHSLALAVLTETSQNLDHNIRLAGDVRALSVRDRLSQLLLELVEGCDPPRVIATHQALATELCSVREVVSRHLHELAEDGTVRLSRGRIEIVNELALRPSPELALPRREPAARNP
jgi:CRP-like cAMP-binding protein